jgi:MFS family permease
VPSPARWRSCIAFTRTPLGRILNAVRDNPERVEFVGYNTQKVRYLAFIIAGFFAGISGGLGALNFEIVTAEVVGAARSGGYLLFTFLGGATFFFGPIIGAILMVLAFILFSEFTSAWLLYLGLIFLFMVMYAPGGIASLIMMNLRVAAFGRLRELWVSYLALAVTALVALTGAAAMIEMVYHLQLNSAQGSTLNFMGAVLDTRSVNSWFGSVFVLATGIGLFEIEIIRGANLAVTAGERVAIIGPNGAGKSTLFHLISARLPITSGAIELKGENVNGLKPFEINRKGLSRSFQITNIFHNLSVFENLRCAVLWSLGYRYSFWHRLAGLKDARLRAER